MFSKNSLVAVVMAALTALTAGCDSKIGEQPPDAQAHEYAGAACLSHTSGVMREFVEGNAKDADLAALWGCLGGAVQSFQRYVRGSDKSRYSSQEIATFLELNFLDQSKGAKISPELQLEFMKLKQLFLGGNVNYITQTELTKMQDVFSLLKGITLRLNPYMKVIVLKWAVSDTNQVQKDMLFFESANTELQNSAKALADHIEKNGQAYDMSDFVTFLQELSDTLGDHWSAVELVRTYMPVVKKTKKALAGGNESIISPTEWRRFSLLGARGYVQYLRYYYFIEQVPETDTGYRLTYLARTAEDVLSVFQDLVAEKPEGVVSRDEVTDLLVTFSKVWPTFKISPNLILQSMKVKQLVFGGSVDSFTTGDFKTARMKVNRLKGLIEHFLPYYPIYSRDWDPQMYSYKDAQKYFMDAQNTLEQSGTELGALVEGPYDLKDLIAILREYEALYPHKEKESKSISADGKYVPMSEQLEKLLPLIVDAKNMVFGGNDSTLSKKIWSPLLALSARVYSSVLYHHYFVSEKPMESSETLWSMSVLSNQSLNLARDILVKKPAHQFSMDEIMQIVNRLNQAGFLPEKMNIRSLRTVLGLAVNNVLVAPEDRLGGYVPNAVTMHSVELLRDELQIWIDTEIYFAQLSRRFGKGEGLRPRDFAAAIEKARTDINSSTALREGMKELGYVVQTPSPMTIDDQGRLYISRELAQVYDQHSMSQLNLDRMVSRLLIRSFAGNLSRIKSYAGVTLDEVNGVFKTVRPFFIDIGMLDPDNDTFGDARFRDANIFMPHSDGNTTASFTELTDLVGMIWSGVKINTMVTEALPQNCLYDQTVKDKAGESVVQKMVKIDCAADSYRFLLMDKMTATPAFRRYLKGADRDETLEFINNIFKSSGYVPNKAHTAKLTDLGQVPHAIQYIEMIFTRFDQNSDGVLDRDEALKAYALFQNLLKTYAGDQVAEKDLDSVFMFLLRYGKAPTSFKEKATWFLRWKGHPENWNVAADRSQLARILGYIADMSNKARAAAIPEISEAELNKQ